jgi:hypothetical protein
MISLKTLVFVLVFATLVYALLDSSKKTRKHMNLNQYIQSTVDRSAMENRRKTRRIHPNNNPAVGFRYFNNQVDQYNGYYFSRHDPMLADINQCVALPKTSVSCMNLRMQENGNNIDDALKTCELPSVYLSDRSKLCTYHPNTQLYPKNFMRKAYSVRTSLNAPIERVVMIKINDSV